MPEQLFMLKNMEINVCTAPDLAVENVTVLEFATKVVKKRCCNVYLASNDK